MTVKLRAEPDKPLVPYEVVPERGTGKWVVRYGQPGPPVVMAAVFATEDEAWAHAERNGLRRKS